MIYLLRRHFVLKLNTPRNFPKFSFFKKSHQNNRNLANWIIFPEMTVLVLPKRVWIFRPQMTFHDIPGSLIFCPQFTDRG